MLLAQDLVYIATINEPLYGIEYCRVLTTLKPGVSTDDLGAGCLLATKFLATEAVETARTTRPNTLRCSALCFGELRVCAKPVPYRSPFKVLGPVGA